MRGVLRKYLMKADSIEKVDLPRRNTRKNFRGASPFKYEMSYSPWRQQKLYKTVYHQNKTLLSLDRTVRSSSE